MKKYKNSLRKKSTSKTEKIPLNRVSRSVRIPPKTMKKKKTKVTVYNPIVKTEKISLPAYSNHIDRMVRFLTKFTNNYQSYLNSNDADLIQIYDDFVINFSGEVYDTLVNSKYDIGEINNLNPLVYLITLKKFLKKLDKRMEKLEDSGKNISDEQALVDSIYGSFSEQKNEFLREIELHTYIEITASNQEHKNNKIPSMNTNMNVSLQNSKSSSPKHSPKNQQEDDLSGLLGKMSIKK